MSYQANEKRYDKMLYRSIGKSGFPNINIECTKQAVFDAKTGEEMPSARHKPNAGSTSSNTGHDHSTVSKNS